MPRTWRAAFRSIPFIRIIVWRMCYTHLQLRQYKVRRLMSSSPPTQLAELYLLAGGVTKAKRSCEVQTISGSRKTIRCTIMIHPHMPTKPSSLDIYCIQLGERMNLASYSFLVESGNDYWSFWHTYTTFKVKNITEKIFINHSFI